MKIFSKLYARMMYWSRHRHAPYYLGAISFIESSLFPIPPDFMLAPMALAKPERAIWYATITTVTSVLGALFGYVLGMFFFHWIHPLLVHFGYGPAYDQVQHWFNAWGVWVMFIAGVAFIPFKIFTIGAGAVHMSLAPFVIGSFIGRGTRFYLVAILMRWGGVKTEKLLQQWADRIGWACVLLLVIGYTLYRW